MPERLGLEMLEVHGDSVRSNYGIINAFVLKEVRRNEDRKSRSDTRKAKG